MWFDDSKGAAVVTLPVALNCTKYKTINYFGNKRHLNFIRKIYKTTAQNFGSQATAKKGKI